MRYLRSDTCQSSQGWYSQREVRDPLVLRAIAHLPSLELTALSRRLIGATLLQICLCLGHAVTFYWAAARAYIHHAAEPFGAPAWFNSHWAVGWKAVQLGFFAANVRKGRVTSSSN